MAENKLADMSTEFAVKILNVTDGIKGHYSLANQLERSGTSIGANIAEAEHPQSNADYLSKMNIALKEANETKFWLRLLRDCKYISDELAESLLLDCYRIIKILATIVGKVKLKIKNTK